MLRNIMVHLDADPSSEERLVTAIALAKNQGATLTGLYVYTGPRLNDSKQQLKDIREMFDQKTSDSGLAADFINFDIGYERIGIAEMVGYYASFTDLLIISQPRVKNHDKQHEFITSPERLLLGSGRPVLVLPANGFNRPIGKRIMVAWKAGPKASRALHDVMPLLYNSDQVNVVSVGDKPFSKDEHQRLSRYMQQHQVQADIHMLPQGELSVSDTILNYAADENVDLLAFGVHITTRRGQFDMGEIGRVLLRQMTVPMIISH